MTVKIYNQPDKRKAKDYRLREHFNNEQANFKNTQKEKSSISEH